MMNELGKNLVKYTLGVMPMAKQDKLIENAKKIGKKKVSILSVCIVLAIIAMFGLFIAPKVFKKPAKQEVVTVSTLEKVVKTSSLSTYETVYNGVAVAMNSEKPDQADYYVAYTATVKAGLDFNKIQISKDDESHTIIVDLPEITIQEPTVKIEEMDFIFINSKISQDGISADAYKRCIQDVKDESKQQSAIYDYAQQNAENLISGLIQPFVSQLGEEYSIVFQ